MLPEPGQATHDVSASRPMPKPAGPTYWERQCLSASLAVGRVAALRRLRRGIAFQRDGYWYEFPSPQRLSGAQIVSIDIGAASPIAPTIVVACVISSRIIAATALNVCDPLPLLDRGGRPLRRRRLGRMR